mgnify:CR=1 FL=1
MRADAVAGTSTGARAVLAELADELVERDADVVSSDPLDWPGYEVQLTRARERRGQLLETIAALLKPGGLLVIGPGEVLGFNHPLLARVGGPQTLAYQRKAS